MFDIQNAFELLGTWRGRRIVQSAALARGYSVPAVFQQQVRATCNKNAIDCNVDQYWDEVSKERVNVIGTYVPDQRILRGKIGYRSSYLDHLYANFDYSTSRFPNPVLDPCMHNFLAEVGYEDMSLGAKLSTEIGRQKQSEFRNIDTNAPRFDGTSYSLREIVYHLADKYKFEECDTRKWDVSLEQTGFYKPIDRGVGLLFGVEFGCDDIIDSRVPLAAYIVVEGAKYLNISLGNCSLLIPGYEFYYQTHSDAEAELGPHALIGLFHEVSLNFDSGTKELV